MKQPEEGAKAEKKKEKRKWLRSEISIIRDSRPGRGCCERGGGEEKTMRTRHTHSWWISLGELGTGGEGAGSGEGRHKYQRERWSRYLRGVDGKKREGVKWGVKHSGHVSHWYTLNRASNRWLTYIIIVIDSWSRCALPPPPPTRTPLRGGRNRAAWP